MATTNTLREVKSWMFPILMSICGFLIKDRLDTIDKRLDQMALTIPQVRENGTKIEYLYKDVQDLKQRIFSGNLPEDNKNGLSLSLIAFILPDNRQKLRVPWQS